MGREKLELEIKSMALSLGYEKCGMISVNEMYGYADKLTERIEKFPDLKERFNSFYDFAYIEKKYPWVKSVVVCVRRYGHYRVPEHLNGVIGKYYLFDGRRDNKSKEYQESIKFEKFLNEKGMKVVTNREFGVTSLRWAAMKAGLGVVRKNNFFYTENGSWVYLEAWLVDKELELKEIVNIKECHEKCNLCIKSCPTKSLCEPYVMNRSSCVSCITTWDGRDMPNEKYKRQIGHWIYGCDVCQDSCPHNKNKWEDKDIFPELDELTQGLTLEGIVLMDYETLQNKLQPKFWYVEKEDVWKWKVNALNAMLNSGNIEYHKYFVIACNDENDKVRDMSRWALDNAALYYNKTEV